MSTPKIKLSYFDFEGSAEPVRVALLLTKTPFEDHRLTFGDEWLAFKATTPSGQVPVMTIDDGPMRTESKAMLRWVGSTFSTTLYDVSTSSKLLDIEEAIGCVDDMLRDAMPGMMMTMHPSNYGHPPDFAATEEGKTCTQAVQEAFVAESLPSHLKRLSGLIAAHGGGPWLVAGSEPTVADCLAVPLLRLLTIGDFEYIPTSCLDSYPDIVQYIKTFCALDGIKGRYNKGIY